MTAATKPLAGRICLVAGATRGAGRAIAVQLGTAGATVYVTGRTTRDSISEVGRATETIEETAELVTEAGGHGIAVPTDHLEADRVRALADRIDREQGRLDVLVNDVWGGEHLIGSSFGKKTWDIDLTDGLRMLELGVKTHLITSHAVLPLLTRHPGGLVVEVTDGTTAYNGTHYRENLFYDLAKNAPIRMAFGLAKELADSAGTAVSISPGWLRSEQMLAHFGVTEDTWREATKQLADFAVSESPVYVGRAVAALAADPDRARWNGRSLDSGQLAREYGFTDADGSRPDSWGFMLAKEADPDTRVEDYR
ncbi:SDR family oxidoreductase [Streptomyces sp. NPDC012769]|uniref:SDR family oxidoreductase n=1 Tax=Streptomyces sp. NPDC012769 TaxID=3364848 RepID=UPI0036824D2B